MDLAAQIGRYEVIRLLGQGGMGRVLLARDSVLGRHVAIKILRDDLGLPPEARQALFARMRQEARAAAALEHPHMVTLHDMGEDEVLGLYLVFEYLTGPTLRDKIAEGPLDVVALGRMARDLGDALTTAHDAGVIHRDVKPENIILSPRGAKITDFGIARLPDSTLTSAGSVLGTPAYSAPESLALAEFSPASDQFSLAVTLSEAISRRGPHQGPEGRLASRLDTVLGRAMAKDPAKRYPSCRAFGEALNGAIEARTIETPRPSEAPPPRSIIPRATRRVHNLIAAVALLVIVGLVVFGRQGRDGVSLHRVSEDFASAAAPARPSETQRRHSHPAAPGSADRAATAADAPLRDRDGAARAADASGLDGAARDD